MKELKNLYNGILNDYSIRRYSMGWQTILDKLDKRYKCIPRDTSIQFESKLLTDAIAVSKGPLRNDIESFARELDINMDTLKEKYKVGTQRSPFGIGS